MTTQFAQSISINPQELTGFLEPLIRKVVQEELAQIVIGHPDVFYLKADSPLRDDLVDILNRKQQGEIRLYSRLKVWGEDEDGREQAALLRSIREDLAPYVVQAMDVAANEEDWEAISTTPLSSLPP
jgi:hypothetical protein